MEKEKQIKKILEETTKLFNLLPRESKERKTINKFDSFLFKIRK